MTTPDTVRYARSADLHVAYEQFGDGAIELVIVPGFISNLDYFHEVPPFGEMFDRLGAFAHCTVFDKRGTGLSDRSLGFGSLEERMDDIRAVVDDAGIERPVLLGYSEGVPLSILFAATYPERAAALVLYGGMARVAEAPDYPQGHPPDVLDAFIDGIEDRWGSGTALRPFVQGIPRTEATTRALARYERGACTPSMAAHILRCNMRIDVRGLLSALTTPTLVLHSVADPLIPVTFGRYLGEHIPGARYLEHDADYHMPWNGANAWFLDETEAFLTGVRPAPVEPERFLSTVVITDIVDSTRTAAELGDHAWRELLDRHDDVAGAQIARFDGKLVKSLGDGLMVTVDGPSRGVTCARAIRDALEPLGLTIRTGVHTGEIEKRGDDIGGIAVHLAARVAAEAAPGEIWVSRTVRDLTAGSALSFADRGRHALKGIAEEWDLYALTD